MYDSVQCPTRDHPLNPLFLHVIPRGVCVERQSRYYHKCSNCAHRAGTPFYPVIVGDNGNGAATRGTNGNGRVARNAAREGSVRS